MILREKLLAIYPELADYDFASGDIQLRNDSDGNGDYIAVWNHPTLAQPTQAQLDAVETP
mgnify:FL=1|tara:strand:+ start:739 stop:918 length:180 start_codon:yes stop_codon:yes gene_type:complete